MYELWTQQNVLVIEYDIRVQCEGFSPNLQDQKLQLWNNTIPFSAVILTSIFEE